MLDATTTNPTSALSDVQTAFVRKMEGFYYLQSYSIGTNLEDQEIALVLSGGRLRKSGDEFHQDGSAMDSHNRATQIPR